MIRDTLILDANPELFLEKTLDDIHFVDQTLRTHLRYIEDSPYLSERDELLEQLSNVEEQFSRVLGDLLNHEGNLSVREIPSLGEKLEAVRLGSLERQKTIGKLDSDEDQDLAGSDELTELLKAF